MYVTPNGTEARDTNTGMLVEQEALNSEKGTLGVRIRRLVKAAGSTEPVKGLTHEFYRYPARFSPQFARAAISNFTEPGQTVLDPFMGGGTSVVEALSLGRRSIGCDINSLSAFITRVKTSPLSERQIERLHSWVTDAVEGELEKPLRNSGCVDVKFRNTPWWIRTKVSSLLENISTLGDDYVQSAARCALLRTAQWALDCREHVPGSREFLRRFEFIVSEMCDGFLALRQECSTVSPTRMAANRRILNRSAIGLGEDSRIPKKWLPVKLVITSPPYPGVHMLYHRWQVRGRRETPAAYAISNSNDGHGAVYYTMGGRAGSGLDRYFRELGEVFSSIHPLLARDCWVIQLVAFSDPDNQVERYLATMKSAGFAEVLLDDSTEDGRIWRMVPSRKWYIRSKKDLKGLPAGKELLLVHRPIA